MGFWRIRNNYTSTFLVLVQIIFYYFGSSSYGFLMQHYHPHNHHHDCTFLHDMNGNVCNYNMRRRRRRRRSACPVTCRMSYNSESFNDGSNSGNMGLNEVQTLLRQAIEKEDYREAARLRDILRDLAPEFARNVDKAKLSWQGLGTAPWLVDRLKALNLSLPTTIQVNAFESVNAMLLSSDVGEDDSVLLEDRLRLSSLAEPKNMGVVVSGSTGSGKSLSFLAPLLSTLSEALFARQRIRVKAEEDIGDAVDDLLERVAVTTSPAILSQQRKQVGGRDGRAALGTLGKNVEYENDIKSPLALIVVPSRELGVQTALLLFELVGGNTRRTKTELYDPGNAANMFKYKGPRGVKIGCVLDKAEAEDGLKLQTDIAITTPEFLGKLLEEGDIDSDKLRVIVFDEADLGLETTRDDDIAVLFPESPLYNSRLTYLVGASVTSASLGTRPVVKSKMLPEGNSYIATATSFKPISWEEDSNTSENANIKDLSMRLDPGLVHERCVISKQSQASGLLVLCRMLRKELRDYTEASDSNDPAGTIERPRVVIFFPSEEEARQSMPKLRDALWGDYKLGVLLPNTGVNPLQIMEQFKFDETGVLLATPNSIRGLDFSGLTHVYTLYMPVDIREYLHLAGRVGRIGQSGSSGGTGGKVTSIIREGEEGGYGELANSLGFSFADVEYIQKSIDEEGLNEDNIEDVRKYLEDTLILLDDEIIE